MHKLCDTCKAVPLRGVLDLAANGEINLNQTELGKIIRDCHLSQWQNVSKFCGTCGTENLYKEEESIGKDADRIIVSTPHRICPKCGRIEYPRICPAIIVLITDDDNRILLAHNRKFRPGIYSHISGFTEAGENLEETVEREVMEEVSIKIKDIEYIRSQPWPFPNSLMVGFKAKYASGVIKPDGEEILDAQWFTKNNMPQLPAKGSLSRKIIDEWLDGKH